MSSVFDRALDSIEDRAWERMMDIRAMRRARKPEYPGYQLTRALANLAHDRRSGFFEAEVSQDLERGGQKAERGGVLVPWETLARADIVGTSAAGGYLVDTENYFAQDALRPTTVTMQLGATVIQRPYGGNISVPTQTGLATATWLSAETQAAGESDQTFGQLSLTPKTLASYTEISRLSLLQSAPSNTLDVVERDLVSVNGNALDLAVMNGPGTGGAPHGIISAAGVQTFTGTALALSGIVNATTAIGDALDYSTGVAANRTTAGLLRTRAETSGSTRTVWNGSVIQGDVTGLPALSTTALPAGTLILGAWRRVVIAVWGSLEVAVNPFQLGNFKSGVVGVRSFLTCDVGITYPGAFNVAQSIT